MLPFKDKTIAHLTSQFTQNGTVELITIRPERGAMPEVVEEVMAVAKKGLEGDHYKGTNGKRSVTLIQKEHIDAVASMMGKDSIDPRLLRRNIVVSGINLHSLKGKKFKLGDALLEHTGPCAPCSRMEENLGHGGYNAMRNHGGICCRVLEGGNIVKGASLEVVA